jgi:hypothetical protein
MAAKLGNTIREEHIYGAENSPLSEYGEAEENCITTNKQFCIHTTHYYVINPVKDGAISGMRKECMSTNNFNTNK